MADDLELKPVDFITLGTVGPRGKRTFHLQAGKDGRILSFIIEKEQAWALSEAVRELLDDLDEQHNILTNVDFSGMNMELREPIEPLWRIAQMGLAYDETDDLILLVAQEYVAGELDEDEEDISQRARLWCTLPQMRALSVHTLDTVRSGRPDVKQNGRIIYYWT